ncbi:putative defensin-like protein 165 [Raphanus sativus]|uniref:Defensin-like protein 165 n=1 Tax=Raphanus sativus TaxID=3726 RepID=A0A6J0MT69_RAPSA|nr:putative defensin-like protein 165 [Raphanus sativus]XP_018475666.1 PREDICTED: putative defensin-like protein 165 [Raphanus sativus]
MSKQFVSCFVVLMVLFSVLLVVPKTEAQKRCAKELMPGTQCLLANCREVCLRTLEGFGTCIEKPAGSDRYTCNCVYNC